MRKLRAGRPISREPDQRWNEYGAQSGVNGLRVTWGGEKPWLSCSVFEAKESAVETTKPNATMDRPPRRRYYGSAVGPVSASSR